jgi:hypothetical protein
MNDDIESYMNTMQNILSTDLIRYIVSIAFMDKNMLIIKKQKKLKAKLNKDVVKLFNTYYYDNNFMVYRNEHNQFILENISMNNKHIRVCSNNTNHSISTELNDDNVNEIVLFEQGGQQEVIYDENGLPVNRRIRLDVVYM